MADEQTTGFKDLDHVRAWLMQFNKPEVAKSRDGATVEMLALLGQAVHILAEEVAALKAAKD